jgi:hypothetical protein
MTIDTAGVWRWKTSWHGWGKILGTVEGDEVHGALVDGAELGAHGGEAEGIEDGIDEGSWDEILEGWLDGWLDVICTLDDGTELFELDEDCFMDFQQAGIELSAGIEISERSNCNPTVDNLIALSIKLRSTVADRIEETCRQHDERWH